MAISGDYPAPVLINGYSCRNCTDVENAKKNIDPAHPSSGPYNVTAETDPDARLQPERVNAATSVQDLRLLDLRV